MSARDELELHMSGERPIVVPVTEFHQRGLDPAYYTLDADTFDPPRLGTLPRIASGEPLEGDGRVVTDIFCLSKRGGWLVEGCVAVRLEDGAWLGFDIHRIFTDHRP